MNPVGLTNEQRQGVATVILRRLRVTVDTENASGGSTEANDYERQLINRSLRLNSKDELIALYSELEVNRERKQQYEVNLHYYRQCRENAPEPELSTKEGMRRAFLTRCVGAVRFCFQRVFLVLMGAGSPILAFIIMTRLVGEVGEVNLGPGVSASAVNTVVAALLSGPIVCFIFLVKWWLLGMTSISVENSKDERQSMRLRLISRIAFVFCIIWGLVTAFVFYQAHSGALHGKADKSIYLLVMIFPAIIVEACTVGIGVSRTSTGRRGAVLPQEKSLASCIADEEDGLLKSTKIVSTLERKLEMFDFGLEAQIDIEWGIAHEIAAKSLMASQKAHADAETQRNRDIKQQQLTEDQARQKMDLEKQEADNGYRRSWLKELEASSDRTIDKIAELSARAELFRTAQSEEAAKSIGDIQQTLVEWKRAVQQKIVKLKED